MRYPFPVRPQVPEVRPFAWGTCSRLQAALYYATCLGWPVFPIIPAGKRPLVARGFHVATVDVAQIQAWWRRWPQAGIGIPTGRGTGLAVLDVDAKGDPETGDDGYGSLAKLAEVRGYEPLPPTRLAATGGGGLHLFYAYPPGRIVTSTTRLGGLPGLDVRANGSYIVCPPSRHASGRLYRWVDEGPLAPYPSFLIDLAAGMAPGKVFQRKLHRPRKQWVAVSYWYKVAIRVARLRARPGNRNALGYWLARRVVEAGLAPGEAEDVMREFTRFVPAGQHPYTVEEAIASLHSARNAVISSRSDA